MEGAVNKSDFISLDDAFDYFENDVFVYELDKLYFHYKGFCKHKDERVYVDGYSVLESRDIRNFWMSLREGGEFFAREFSMKYGEVDGVDKDLIGYTGVWNMDLDGKHDIHAGDVYVNKNDLDEFHNKLGIPYKSDNHDRIDESVNTFDSVLNPKAEKTHLHIIGALLDYIKGDTPTIDKHQSFKSEAAMIAVLAEQYRGYSGMSKRTLETKFAMAKRLYEV